MEFYKKISIKNFISQAKKDLLHIKFTTITLDSFVKKNKIKSIDILKIDIEGIGT